MKRIDTETENLKITQESPKLFTVRSLQLTYQVWLGSETQLPSCQCIDYRKNKLPCKHICAVVGLPGVGWESLGSKFSNHPLFTLDLEVTQLRTSALAEESELPSEVDKYTASCDIDSVSTGMVSTTSANRVQEGSSSGKSESMTVNLPSRKKSNIREQCIKAVKTLHDELYIATDRDVLTKTLQMITDIIQYTRKHHPSENGITLKNKSLSPKKPKNKSKFKNVIKLTTRKKKNYFTKRVGTFADSVNAKVIVDETGEVTTKRKRSKAPLSQLYGKKQKSDNGKGNENEYNPSDVWVVIGTIKLTYNLKDILLTQMDIRFAWLSDDHIDAVQHLIKELGTGVGGLNCIATMTHCTRFAVPHGGKPNNSVPQHRSTLGDVEFHYREGSCL